MNIFEFFELNIELNVFFSIIQRSIEFLISIVQGYSQTDGQITLPIDSVQVGKALKTFLILSW